MPWYSCSKSTFCHDVKVKGKERECCEGLGGLRAIRHGSDARDTLFFELWSSSMTCDVEEVSSESSKKMKDMDESSCTAVTKQKKKRCGG